MMQIVDVATSIEGESLVPLGAARTLYRWSERNQRVFERFHRFRSICLHQTMDLRTLLRGCLHRLVTANRELLGTVDYLIYSHSLHSTVPVDRVFLDDMAAEVLCCRPETLSVTQGSCASGLMSVEMLRALTAGTTRVRAVLLTGEKCFDRTLQYVDQNGIYGEGATAVYFSNASADGGVSVASVAWATLSGLATRLVATDREASNGYDRAFVPMMAATVEAALEAARAPVHEVGAILPYHMSPPTFDRLARAIGLSPDVVVRTHLYEVGHCFCGDAFINLRSWLRQGGPSPRRPYLVALAAGITGTFAAMIVRVDGAHGRDS